MMSALLALLLAAPATAAPPAPTPAIVWVRADGAMEIARIAFLGFDADRPPRAPETLVGKLYCLGRATPVTLHRRWQGAGAVAGGWVPADYLFEVPRGMKGAAVLSLGTDKQGWSFRL